MLRFFREIDSEAYGGIMGVPVWSPSGDQKRFIKRWAACGKARATIDDILSDASENKICMLRVAGKWQFYWVGEEHFWRDGVMLKGDLGQVMPQEDAARFQSQFTKVLTEGVPFRFRGLGIAGFNRHNLATHVTVPVRPPPGAEVAVMCCFHWQSFVEAENLIIVRELLLDKYGERFLALLDEPGAVSPRTLISMVRAVTYNFHDRRYWRAFRLKFNFERRVFFAEPLSEFV